MNSMVNPTVAMLFHSLWQSALLLFIFGIHQTFVSNQSPQSKKLRLLLLVLIQMLTSVITFILYGNNSFSEISTSSIIGYLNPETLDFVSQYSPVAFFIYVAFFLFKSTQTIFEWNTFKRNTKNAFQKPDVELKLFTLRKSFELGIKKKVKIWYAENIQSPITFGHFKPVILLPVALINQLSMEETEALIIHELTHIKNNDFIINWLVIVTEHVYFFNPFLRIICNKIKWEREISCDLQVLQFNYNNIMYAGSLYKVAAQNKSTNHFQLNAAKKGKQLLNRISYFTSLPEFKFRRDKKNPVFIFSTILLLLLLSITFSVKQISTSEKQEANNIKTTVQKNSNSKLIFISDANNEIKPVITAAAFETKEKPVLLKKSVKNKLHIQKDINEHIADASDINAINASHKDENAIEKQIIVKEEDPITGKIVTTSYRLINNNNKWTTQLLWVIEENASSEKNSSQHSSAIPEVQ